MGRLTIEQSLIAARPDEALVNTVFINKVMEKIQEKPVIISSALRITNEQHNSKGGLFMSKLRTLPVAVLAVIIIGAAALTSVAAYTVYKSVIEPLTVEQTGSVNQDGKKQTTFAVAGCPSYDGVSQDEIIAVTDSNSAISSEEARSYVIARCELNAISKYAHDVDEKGSVRYDSWTLSTVRPVAMPAADVNSIDLDVGPRAITSETKYYKDGKLVDRAAIAEGSLVHVAYGGVASKAKPNVLLVVAATVDAKYYDDYGSGVSQRVPCFNNPSESCFSDIPGYPFYSALSVDTGPVPAGEERYAEAIMNKAYTQFGGIVTYVEGNAYTFRTSTGRSVTFYLPEGELEQERAPEQALPTVGTEIIVTSISNDRDAISSSDLLSGYRPILSN